MSNIAQEDLLNYIAHIGFGLPLVIASMVVETFRKWKRDSISDIAKKLYQIEKYVWLLFGSIIILTQHNWLQDGFTNLGGDMQHVMIGIAVCFFSVSAIVLERIQNFYSRLCIAMVYILLSMMMMAHTQSNDYGRLLHVSFGAFVLAIGILHFIIWCLCITVCTTAKLAVDNLFLSLQSLFMQLAGVIFCGASYVNIQNAMISFHPPMYLILLLLIAFLLFVWWQIVLHFAFQSTEESETNVSYEQIEVSVS